MEEIEKGKKQIELLRKKKRLNIEVLMENQVNQDLLMKTNIAKENKMKAIEQKKTWKNQKKRNYKQKEKSKILRKKDKKKN